MGDSVAHEIGPDGGAGILPARAELVGDPSLPTGSLAAWLRLAHPAQLIFGVAPAAITLALLPATGTRFQPVPAVCTVVALVLVQAGAHILNEYVEFERGKALAAALAYAPLDDHPISVAAAHPLLALRTAIMLLALGACAGIPLVATGGAPVAILGVLGLAAAVLYSSTDFALKRLPGGELVVPLALGPGIAVATALGQRQPVTSAVLLTASALGLLTLAYMIAADLRTRDDDARVGLRSLAVVLPESAAKLLYIAAVVLAFVLALIVSLPRGAEHGAAAVVLALPAMVIASTSVARAHSGAARATTTGQTLRMYASFALWLLIGLLAGDVVVRLLPHL